LKKSTRVISGGLYMVDLRLFGYMNRGFGLFIVVIVFYIGRGFVGKSI
jgi:hypothetical protein